MADRQIVVQLLGNAKGFNKALDDASGRASGFGSKMGSIAKDVAKVGLVMAGAFVGIGAASLKFAVDFEKDMANVQTLIGSGSESDKRLGELKDSVKSISTETGKSLEDLAGGLYQVISAFGDTADSAGILDVAAKASTAGLSTTTEAVNLLSAVTKGYGDTSLEAVQHTSDLAFQTVVLGQTTFPELAASMGKVIPVAATMGVKQEELFAVMSTLTGVTGNTAEAVTQVRSAMVNMLKPNENMTRALKELGYTGADAGKELISDKGLVGAMKAIADSGAAGSVGIGKLFENAEALPAIFALTGDSADTFATKLAAMNDVAGATDEAFAIQEKTASASMDKIGASIHVLMVNLGEKLLPAFEKVLNWVLDNWPEIEKTFNDVITAIMPVLEMAAENLSKNLPAAIKIALDAWETIKPVVLEVARIIGDVVAAVQEGLDMIVGFFQQDSKDINGATSQISETLDKLSKTFAAVFKDLQDNVKVAMDLLTMIWDTWGDDIQATVGVAFEYIMSTLNNALTIIQGIFDTFSALLRGDWQGVWDGLLTIFEGFWNQIASYLKFALDLIPLAIGAAGKVIAGTWDAIWKGLAAGVGAAWEGIKAAIGTAIDAVRGVIEGTLDLIVTTVLGLPSRITSAARGMFNGIKDAFRGALNLMASIWNGISFSLPSIPNPLGGSIGGGSFSVPHIGPFHSGGIVPGTPGREVMALVQAGERITPLSGRGGGGDIHIHIDQGAYIDGPSIDRLALRLTQRLRYARGT